MCILWVKCGESFLSLVGHICLYCGDNRETKCLLPGCVYTKTKYTYWFSNRTMRTIVCLLISDVGWVNTQWVGIYKLKLISGKNTSNKLLAVTRQSWIYVTRFQATITEMDIKDHLKSSCSEHNVICEKLPTKHTSYNSFKIGVPTEIESEVMNPDLWPTGILIVKNVYCVIYLACKVVPHSPTVTLMLRLTQQLVRIFQTIGGKTWEETLSNTKSTETQVLLSQLFKLTHTIVYKMNVAKDHRGLKIFLEEDSLRRALLASLDSDNKIVTHPTLNLLTYLEHSQKLYNIQIKNTGTVMGAEFLLQLMSTNRADTAFFTAKLFSNMRILDRKIFITLSSEMSNTTIHTLYLQFQNFSVRHDVVSSLGWRCESRLLQYCSQHNPLMEQHLLTQPLNELTLQVAFEKNAGIKDAHLAEYLHTYMIGVRAHKLVSHRSYARAICRDPVSTILTMVADQLLTRDWPSGSLQSQLIYQICTIGGNIPQQTINALKVKMRRYKKFGRQ